MNGEEEAGGKVAEEKEKEQVQQQLSANAAEEVIKGYNNYNNSENTKADPKVEPPASSSSSEDDSSSSSSSGEGESSSSSSNSSSSDDESSSSSSSSSSSEDEDDEDDAGKTTKKPQTAEGLALEKANLEVHRLKKLIHRYENLLNPCDIDECFVQVAYRGELDQQQKAALEEISNTLLQQLTTNKKKQTASVERNKEKEKDIFTLVDERYNIQRLTLTSMFQVDTKGSPLLVKTPQNKNVPSYDRSTNVLIADSLTNSSGGTRQPKLRTCWNCDALDHEANACPLPRNRAKYVENQRNFLNLQQGEMSGDSAQKKAEQGLRLNFSGYEEFGNGLPRPGFLSQKLRNALGIGPEDPPPYYQRIRLFGYPVGYLRSRHQNVDTIDIVDEGDIDRVGVITGEQDVVKIHEYPLLGDVPPPPEFVKSLIAENNSVVPRNLNLNREVSEMEIEEDDAQQESGGIIETSYVEDSSLTTEIQQKDKRWEGIHSMFSKKRSYEEMEQR